MIPYQSGVPANIQSQSQHIIANGNGNYHPNVITENNYAKKSYNYMASPNYLQYENTYQKYKKICHNKDVSNFRDSNISHYSNSNFKSQQQQQLYNYDNDSDHETSRTPAQQSIINDNLNCKTNNTMQTLSSDDEGGFRRDLLIMKNQFNNSSNNGIANNIYSTKEIEPLLHGNNSSSGQITKVILIIFKFMQDKNKFKIFFKSPQNHNLKKEF